MRDGSGLDRQGERENQGRGRREGRARFRGHRSATRTPDAGRPEVDTPNTGFLPTNLGVRPQVYVASDAQVRQQSIHLLLDVCGIGTHVGRHPFDHDMTRSLGRSHEGGRGPGCERNRERKAASPARISVGRASHATCVSRLRASWVPTLFGSRSPAVRIVCWG
jgi:hypothetical protein